eukprot:gnl/MRDRNA2_/MRDRNA2_138524_c0_seq1.p1 gnl/MRDRNA2_/MRDRNA2_138524_c0~~gnl/MRDRNA2_/MRDRNA2_138524_c0_seq1.p1  ORF type:complete len:398 (-),score=71.55 gnl/MRDRNA2_/MRDRNA2_138524_c0_seq1:108-1301(-)
MVSGHFLHFLISLCLAVAKGSIVPQDAMWRELLGKLQAEGKDAYLLPAVFNHSGMMLRGAAASKDLKPGDIVLSLPESLSVNVESSEGTSLFGKHLHGTSELKDLEEDDVPGWLRLTTLLATERVLGESSPWHSYIAHLPTLAEFRSFLPLMASDDLLHRFAVLPLVQQVAEYRKWMKEDWARWSAFIEHEVRIAPVGSQRSRKVRRAALKITQDDLAWAFAVVLTRAFSLGPSMPIVLEPLADDLNMAQTWPHDENNIHWYRQWGTHSKDPVFELRATKAVKAGTELLESYGDNDNDGLASQWGFLLPGKSLEVEILPEKDCESLASAIQESQEVYSKSRLRKAGRQIDHPTRSAVCIPPAREPQPIIFCTLAKLALQHFRKYKDFPHEIAHAPTE